MVLDGPKLNHKAPLSLNQLHVALQEADTLNL